MYRPIQAKAALSAEQQASKAPEPPPPRPKNMSRRNITTTACQPCRKRKSKCDGLRPECSSCQQKGTTDQCSYEADTDKKAALRKKVANLEKELDGVKELLPLLVASKNNDSLARLVQELQQNGLSKTAVETTQQLYQELNQIPGNSEVAQYASNQQQPFLTQESLYADSSAGDNPDLSYLSAPIPFEYDRTDPSTTETFPPVQQPYSHQPPQSYEQQYDQEDEYLRDYFRKLSLGHDPWTTSPVKRGSKRRQESIDDDTSSSGISTPARTGVELTQSGPRLQAQRSSQSVLNSGFIHVFGNLPMSSSILTNHNPVSIRQNQVDNLRLPLSSIQALNFEDHPPSEMGAAGALSAVYSDFRQMKRRLIAQGVSEADAIGPMEMDFETIYSGQSLQRAANSSASAFAASIAAVSGLPIPERIACAYMNRVLVQWQIAPTAESYAAVPEGLRPSAKQLFFPHHACVDYLPWPLVRDTLLDSPDDFVAAFTAGLSVNWPLEPEDAVILDPETGVTVLNPVFENHIRDVNNWSVHSNALKQLPQLDGKVRINDEAGGNY